MSTLDAGGNVNRFKFVLQSRGLANSVERAWQVATRFGLTAGRMEKRLVGYAALVGAYGARPSLPITAKVLARNPHVARNLVGRGVELCVHGLVHNDLSRLSPEEQARQIGAACDVFREHDIPFRGFRSPYLKYNRATLDAVAAAGFDYDSNLPFFWADLPGLGDLAPGERDGLERGLRFYGPVRHPEDRSLPRMIGRLVEIPVSLPDDEILLDRMGCPVEKLGRIWQEMLAGARSRGELLTLQLHPERLTILERALGALLAEAASAGDVWLTTLGEIARWWRERLEAGLVITPSGPGRFAIRGAEGSRADWYLALSGDPDDPGLRPLALPGNVTSELRPVIGADPKAGPDLRTDLRQSGYYVEESTDSGAYPVFIKPGMAVSEVLAAVRTARAPLVVQGTWPRHFRAAMAATGDIDCLTLGDFARRFREN